MFYALRLPTTPARHSLTLINRATTLALVAHCGQTRKDGRTPQIVHPMAVQGALASAGVVDAEIHAASVLHDAVEDNPGTRGQAQHARQPQQQPRFSFSPNRPLCAGPPVAPGRFKARWGDKEHPPPFWQR